MMDSNNIIYLLIIWNILVFFIYGIDKLKSKTHRFRIPEKFLLSLAVSMGAFGALLGMKIFNHKTNHKLFILGIPMAIVINIYILMRIKSYFI